MISPCGTWVHVGYNGPMLRVDNWFIPVDGDSDVLKPEVVEFLNDNHIDYVFSGYSVLGPVIVFKTEAGGLLFRMYWDDRVPR